MAIRIKNRKHGRLHWIKAILLPGIMLLSLALFTCERFTPAHDVYLYTDTIIFQEGSVYVLSGGLLNTGDQELLDHGFCWSEKEDASLDRDPSASLGPIGEPGEFSTKVEGLKGSTLYYVRAYAKTGEETTYSDVKWFTTRGINLPTVVTTGVSKVALDSASAGGEVTSDGGLAITARGVCWSTAAGPTTADEKTSDSTGTGAFTSRIRNLVPGTAYYLRAYATNSLGTAYGEELTFRTWNGTVEDVEGNMYYTVEIGEQLWMQSNMRSRHFADGSAIPFVEEKDLWEATTASDYACCYYENDTLRAEGSGLLYTWSTAMYGEQSSNSNPSDIQGVCPDGWHLPSDQEWSQLEIHLGMDEAMATAWDFRGADENVGGQMKNLSGWSGSNRGATNSSGFSALPGGARWENGTFTNGDLVSVYWTATQGSTSESIIRLLSSDYGDINRSQRHKKFGMSVRCVK